MKSLRKNLFEFHEEMGKQGIIFCFYGPMTQNFLKEIVKNLKGQKVLEDAGKHVMNRLIGVIIELLQNVIYYSAEPLKSEKLVETGDKGDGLLMIGNEIDTYFVSCGNPIAQTKVKSLVSKLEKLQKLSKEEIKELFRKQLNTLPNEVSRGAGLGFTELAKKSSRPLEFDFSPIDKKKSYFSITTFI